MVAPAGASVASPRCSVDSAPNATVDDMNSWPRWRIVVAVTAGAALAGALWISSHRAAVAEARAVVAVLLIVFFTCCAAAMVGRPRPRSRFADGAPSRIAPQHPEGTVHGLVPGRTYRIVTPFTDHYSNRFEQGETLKFRERHFLPYHGGHTLVFEERAMYLQEEANAAILDNFARYVAATDSAVS